ncbi:MAG: hypothetical protein WBL15_02825 [Phycisphaerae bacterium]|nr:hypothetical protein [Phycisphaerae bacterium]
MGWLVLYSFEWTVVPVVLASGLFFIGLMMLRMRLFYSMQEVKPRY